MVTLEKPLQTYADYLELPEGAPYQLVGGSLIMSPAPTPRHQLAAAELSFSMMVYLKKHGIGRLIPAPIDVYLTDTEVYQPDLLIVAQNRLAIIGEKKIEGAPDLIVEILSPSTGYYDLTHKKRVYEAAGVREYWIVDPLAQRVEVYTHADGRFQLFSEAAEEGQVASKWLAGFAFELDELFS